jgi:hypothetical protein
MKRGKCIKAFGFNGLSNGLRRVLHRTIDLIPDSGHAAWQTGERALRAVDGRQSLPVIRPARAAGCLHKLATFI